MRGAVGERLSRWLVPALIVAVTFAVAPGGEAPFSGVKTGLLLAGSVVLLLQSVWMPAAGPAALAPRVLAGLWLGTLALSALLGPAAVPGGMWLEAAAGLVVLALLQAPPPWAPVFRAIAGAGTGLALVAGLQALGADPFLWMGWAGAHPGERMRIYGTLGNPDFVAAYLGASLCVTVGEAVSAERTMVRRGWIAAAVLQLCALASTRSWGSLLALGAAALSLLWSRAPTPKVGLEQGRRGRRWGFMLAAVAAGALLLLSASGRSPSAALAGRRYLWGVAAPHVLDAPVFGHGPGSFEVLWPLWEAEYWSAREDSSEKERFAALQDHAHLDYLEWLLELGLVGTAPRLLLLLAALRAARQAPDARGRAALAALVALAARALVDFPLARPAELCLFAVLLSVPVDSEYGTGPHQSGRRRGAA
ncbi:O-antigen ligase family protein [Hyalangium minutum]|uniref:Polysaccharide transport protein n=1 Tax=Hyalangium minutum TaxID=394096 RepID=A0A085WFJ9_9BACT|nr:O-antigen ligase family protein [Hyalangium minutum]KFE66462.1 polysaccharide transport protein [Hyalangium minutum]